MIYEGIDFIRRMIIWCWLGLYMKYNRIDINID